MSSLLDKIKEDVRGLSSEERRQLRKFLDTEAVVPAPAPVPTPAPARSQDKRVTKERRRSPRYQTQLDARLFFMMVVGEGRDKLDFAGHTLNVSETGLALIVPVMEIDEFHQMREKTALRIELHLPDVAVEIHAKLVPYESKDEENAISEGYVVGAEITWVSDPARYKEFLRTLDAPPASMS